jgi:hypothetical protein
MMLKLYSERGNVYEMIYTSRGLSLFFIRYACDMIVRALSCSF